MRDQRDLFLRRQRLLGEFGELALQSEDIDEFLNEACRLVAEAMGTARAKVLEIEDDGNSLLVRAGVGWGPSVVGEVHLVMSANSSETFSIREKCPVIVQDIDKEPRFDVPEFMKKAGVVALANVPILLPGGKAYGLLQVDDTRPRQFAEEDAQFLRTYATILGSVVDRLFKLSELRTTEQRFRLGVEEAKDYAIFLVDTGGRVTDWFPGAEEVFGYGADEMVGKAAKILWTPEDRASNEDEKEIATATQNGVASDVRWHMRKDGSRVFIEGSMRALRNRAGAIVGFLKIGQDATERQSWRDRQQILVAELQHRTSNLMGVVRRIADQALRSSQDLNDFGRQFGERISSLSRVQALLARLEEDDRISFDELIGSELAALGGQNHQLNGQVRLHGPKGIALRSSTVHILALAIHELFTNALKYGALRQPEGNLTISWRLESEVVPRRLHVDWRESGIIVPAQDAPPQGGGAGRELIERALPYQLGAETTYTVETDGIRCTIALPVSGKKEEDGQ